MKKFIKIACLVAVFSLVLLPSVSLALDLGTGYGQQIGLGTKDIRETVAQILKVAMGLLGIIAVCIILYGGFVWMTAGGNKEKVDKARKIIIAGVIGLVIIMTSYAIATFVIQSLISAT